jgi:FMN phosphatase YigB (HAD superfamily)
MNARVQAVVFDIGNVLVKWDAALAFLPDLGSRAAAEAFLARVDFSARNYRGDGGESFRAMASEIADPADAAIFARYPDRMGLAVAEPISGTWDIIDALRARATPLHAITNWSAETWPAGLGAHPRLTEVFGTIIVSGLERMVKPQPEIFHLMCARTGLAPQDCLFVDDAPANVDGARAVGMAAHLFTTPEALRADLTERGML